MGSANDVIGDFVSPCGEFEVTFDDNGKVAYAYLKRGNTILGDVWLYNRCGIPEQPEWRDRKNLPFANCKEFMTEEGYFDQPVALDDIRIEWQYSSGQPTATVYVMGHLVASLGVNDKPGYCRFASKDGPLAKVLITDQN